MKRVLKKLRESRWSKHNVLTGAVSLYFAYGAVIWYGHWLCIPYALVSALLAYVTYRLREM